MELEDIPTVDFDPRLHVIAGRERREGRPLFFKLESIVDDIQMQPRQPQNVDGLSAVDANMGEIVAGIMPNIERRFAELQASIPPMQLSQETAHAMAEMTNALIENRSMIANLANKVVDSNARVERVEKTLFAIADRLEAAP